MKKDKAIVCNLSMPTSVYKRLLEESEKVGLNRSAYVSMILTQKWSNDDTMQKLPELIESFNGLTTAINKASKATKKSGTTKSRARATE